LIKIHTYKKEKERRFKRKKSLYDILIAQMTHPEMVVKINSKKRIKRNIRTRSNSKKKFFICHNENNLYSGGVYPGRRDGRMRCE
jgi:hypothetical protein